MKRRVLLILLCFVFVLTAVGCQSASPSDNAPTADEAEDLAFTVANAVMNYDLTTLKEHAALGMNYYETLVRPHLTITEDGKFDWDGLLFDTVNDFMTAYDAEMNGEYKKLEITVTSTTLYENEDAAEVIAAADTIEKLFRSEEEMTVYALAVAGLTYDRVAVCEVSILFQNADKTEPGGEIATYPETAAAMTVTLVEIDGTWRSYSPSLGGTFPPLGTLQRYLTAEEKA